MIREEITSMRFVFYDDYRLGLVRGENVHDVSLALGDVSGLERGFFIGKSFDTFAPMGPALVTADEVPDPQALRVELDVNGEARQRFGTDDMANGVRDLIAFASAIATLRPGDVIATGTNHQALSPIQEGDQVEIRIADWPPLRFQVHDPSGRTWARQIDPEMAARARQSRG
jgi:2-keto-4-pentenoate hydratase/2-oxohepta-3-ene-1,7-dioic acid hydratase in catechol pathway